jgi:hypothetical protein
LCGDPDHFIANHPKIKGKSDSGKRKDKHDYAFVKHKSQGRKMSKEALKKKYIKNTKAQKYAFLASLSDPELDSSDNDSSSSSDDESKKKLQDKLNKLCFLTDTARIDSALWHLVMRWWVVMTTTPTPRYHVLPLSLW